MLAPKALGAWHLHRATAGMDLDFFVLFSSVASVLGSAGQGNYAAANAYLDGLAWYRRSRGLPALSINWGPWGEVGMAAQLAAAGAEPPGRRGGRPIPPALGVQALGTPSRVGAPQWTVLPVDWPGFLRQRPNGVELALLRGLVREDDQGAQGVRPEGGSTFRQQLEETSAAQRRDLILTHVRERALKVLGFFPPTR